MTWRSSPLFFVSALSPLIPFIMMALSDRPRRRKSGDYMTPDAYASIVENMTDAVIVLDEKQRVIGINPSACRLFAASQEDYGEPIHKILGTWPELAEQVLTLINTPGIQAVRCPLGRSWMDVRISDIQNHQGRNTGRFIIIRDITESKRTEEERLASLERIQRQQQSLFQLSVSSAAARGDFLAAVKEITETAARALGVERVSLWLGNAKEGAIRCLDLFENSRNLHSEGAVLLADHFPRYFEAISRDRVIDVQDAPSDPRTREFNDEYLRPLNIGALLDAPIRVSGVMIGIICCEHIGGARPWLDDEIRFAGEIAVTLSQAYTNLEKRRTDDAHRESEDRFRMLVEGAPEAIFVEVEGAFSYLNAAAVTMFGAGSPERLLGHPIIDRFHPDYRDQVRERIRLLNEEKKNVPRAEEVYLRLDGTAVDAEISAVPIKYRELDGALVFVRDITERKKAEKILRASLREKEVLLREVQHRVRNNMQIISSLLNHQAGAISDPGLREVFRASQNRIKSIALIHEKLYRAGDLSRIDFADYIQSLVIHLFHVRRIDPMSLRYTLDLERIDLDVNVSIPLGLIVNELVLNSLQHAFPAGRKGEVFVRWTKSVEGIYSLQVRDDGIGFPGGLDLRSVKTLGLQIVQMLVEQINGDVIIETPPGTSITISFDEFRDRPGPGST